MQKDITLDGVVGILDNFIIEPAFPHKDEEEIYVCIQSHRYFDEIFFYHQGGVDVGDVDAKALRMNIPVDTDLDKAVVIKELMKEIPAAKKDAMATFVVNLYNAVFLKAHFTYLEINPVVMTNEKIVPLDCAAKIDETAAFLGRATLAGYRLSSTIRTCILPRGEVHPRDGRQNWSVAQANRPQCSRLGLDHGGWRWRLSGIC
jgi:ATP citrate (pro-S)-lyase